MPDTSITATDVISQFGAYYIDHGQNQDNLKMRPFESFGTLDAFTIIPTEDTQMRFADSTMVEILQRYQDGFTPKGGVTFKPIAINLNQIKIDQQFNPNNLVYTWLGFLTSSNTDRTTWPFIRWFVEMYLLKQHDKDFETKVIYKGVQAAIVAGTAGATAGVMTGVKKVINDKITATTITPIATGALSTDPQTFYEQIETFVRAVPELFWDTPMTLNMSKVLAQRFRDGKKKKYNMYYAQDVELNRVADFEVSVAGRFSMQGSDKIWMTPKENLIMGVKGWSNKNSFELEKIDRNVKIWTDYHAGFGFLMDDLIFTNDRDLV